MGVDVTAAENLPPRADELFRIFARFEFALKMVGYATMSRGMVKIRWDEFAKSAPIGDQFFREVQASKDYPLLLTDPPKADRITDGQYGFEQHASYRNVPTTSSSLSAECETTCSMAANISIMTAIGTSI